jgi:hypothetical protein
VTGRWLAAVIAAVDLARYLPVPRRPGPAAPAPFAAHVLPQRCDVHGVQVVSVLEPGCGCPPA